MSLKIKGEFQTLFRFIINNTDNIESDIASQVGNNPDLFHLAPIIIEPATNLDLFKIVSACHDNGLIPVGVKTTNGLQIKQAETLRLRVSQPKTKNSVPAKDSKTKKEPELGYKIVSKPIRSGQQVYAKEAHLVIMRSVGAGSEVMADGDIHIYGALRGRAMAGVQGRQNSRIISQDMDAELIAIAGNYIVREDMPEIKGAAQATLDHERIQFEKL